MPNEIKNGNSVLKKNLTRLNWMVSEKRIRKINQEGILGELSDEL